MEKDKMISSQVENQNDENELTQEELEKISGGLKMDPTVYDPDLTLNGVFGGRGGMSGDLGEGVA